MKHWRLRCAASALVLASLPLTGLASAAISRADDGCGEGMYWNYETNQCEPWVAAPGNVYIDPYIPVPIPVWNPCIGPCGIGPPGIGPPALVPPGVGPPGIGGPGGPG